MRAYFVSMGCPKNTVDMEAALSSLRSAGHCVTDDPFEADILLVNACSFIRSAWEETLEELRRLADIKKGRKGVELVLMGCLPLHLHDAPEDALEDVDRLVPPGAHGSLADLLSDLDRGRSGGRRPVHEGPAYDPFAGLERRELLTPPHSAYVKISEGCSHSCTYCSIPLIKGPMVSRNPESIVREVEGLVGKGVREITLVAQDPASYEYRGLGLPGLVEMLAGCGPDWIRILYLHPASMRIDDVIRLLRIERVCPYLDVPFQHVSDAVLKRMRRGYGGEYLGRFFSEVRAAVPDVVFRGEALVGFPGESERDFELLKEFVERVSFSSLGIFTFSAERGTEAYGMADGVPPEVASARLSELWEVQQNSSFSGNSSLLGSRLRILVDREVSEGDSPLNGPRYAGRYYGQAPEIDGEVFLLSDTDLSVGGFVEARVVDATSEDLIGEVLS